MGYQDTEQDWVCFQAMARECLVTRKFSREVRMGRRPAGEEAKGELPCSLVGCPETDVACPGVGGVGGAENPLNLTGGDADYPVNQICFIKAFGYAGGETSEEPGGLTVGGIKHEHIKLSYAVQATSLCAWEGTTEVSGISVVIQTLAVVRRDCVAGLQIDGHIYR